METYVSTSGKDRRTVPSKRGEDVESNSGTNENKITLPPPKLTRVDTIGTSFTATSNNYNKSNSKR